MQPLTKKRRLENPPTPHKWTCLQTLLGPSCVDFDNNPAGQGEFKTERDCKASDCYQRPSQFGFEEKGVLDLLGSYLDASSIGVLSSHDRESAAALSNRLTVATLAELLSDGFFTAIWVPDNDRRRVPVEKYWEKLRQMVMAPRDELEREAAQVAISNIIHDLEGDLEDVLPDDLSALLFLMWNDEEFVNRIIEWFPDTSDRFLWNLTEGLPERIVSLSDKLNLDDVGEWWPRSRSASESELVNLMSHVNSKMSSSNEPAPRPLIAAIVDLGHSLIESSATTENDLILSEAVFDLATNLLMTGADNDTLVPIHSLLSQSWLWFKSVPRDNQGLVDVIHALARPESKTESSERDDVGELKDETLALLARMYAPDILPIEEIRAAIRDSGLALYLPMTMAYLEERAQWEAE